MPREQFEDHFIRYRAFLREEIHRFRDSVMVYRNIQEQKTNRLELINIAPAFFAIVEGALFTTIVMWADKLFDEQGERGFFNFLSLVEQNRKWLSVAELQQRRSYPDDHWMLQGRALITYDSIEADRDKIRSLKVLASLRLRRDKFHGHFDKDYFFDRKRLQDEAPIHWNDLQIAGEVMGGILNDYSADFDGACYCWDTLNNNDLEVLLRKAAHGLSNDAQSSTHPDCTTSHVSAMNSKIIQKMNNSEIMEEKTKLYILWTNDNPVTAELMVFMYGVNAKKRQWWQEVTIIVWGATTKLVAENKKIQELIEEAQLEGVHITACRACADQLGVTSRLKELNIEVIYWGEPLTQLLKNNEKLLTI